MRRSTVTLAWAWLGFATLGLAYAAAVVIDLLAYTSPAQYTPGPSRLAVALFVLALWTLPLALGSIGLLFRRRWGRVVLLAHVSLGVLLWAAAFYLLAPIAWAALRNRFTPGPYWGFPGLPLQALFCLAMALFSAATAWALLRDRPA